MTIKHYKVKRFCVSPSMCVISHISDYLLGVGIKRLFIMYTTSHILLKYFELVFLQLLLLEISCTFVTI